MLMKKNIILIFVLTILTISCGYQKISQNYPLVYLQNIKIDGETRLAYIVKNNILLISDQTAKDKYDIDHSFWLKLSLTLTTLLILLYFVIPGKLVEIVSRINII